MPLRRNGFTLVELLVVISIISILSVVGFVVFKGVSDKAKDAKIKADLNAIKKAYEANYDPTANGGQGGYKPLADSNFAGGKIPTPPGGGLYSCAVGPDIATDNSIGYFCATNRTNAPPTTNATQGYSVSGTSSTGTVIVVSNQGTLPQSQLSSCDPGGLLSNGLVGYWKMDGNFNDSTSNANNGTAQNGATISTTTVKFGSGAASFSGTAYVNVPHSSSLNVSNAMTLSMWLSPTSLSAGGIWNDPITKMGANWCGFQTVLWGGGGTMDLRARDGAGGVDHNFSTGGIPLTPAWTHLVFTFDSGVSSNNAKLYKNGSVVSSMTIPGTICTNSSSLLISNSGETFLGYIDDVRVYNRALTDQEITSLQRCAAP